PPRTNGSSRSFSKLGSGSESCRESSRTPSTCWLVRWLSTRLRSAGDGAIASHSCNEVSNSPELIPRTMPAKNGSPNTRSSDSETTSATESVRRVTSERAARLGTYPSLTIARSTAARAAGLTCGDPLTTRDTVPRPTPARAATSSRVGRPPERARCAVMLCSRRPPAGHPAGGALARPATAGSVSCRVQSVPLDHSGIPSGARLWDASLRCIVDIHDTEALRESLCPFKIVQQRPHEIPTQRNSVGDRLMAGAQVSVEIRHAVVVIYPAVGLHLVVERGAVLADVQRYRWVIAVQPEQNLAQPAGVDLPPHGGDRPARLHEPDVLATGVRRTGAAFVRLRGGHDVALVVVDRQEGARRGDRGQVPVADVAEVADPGEVGDHVGRIGAAQHRVQEQPVAHAVHAPDGLRVLVTVAGRADRAQVERDADVRARIGGPDGL